MRAESAAVGLGFVGLFFFKQIVEKYGEKKSYRLNKIYNPGPSRAECMSVMYNLNLYPWQNEIIT